MYHEYFGLRQAPFRITPDTRLFFPGGKRGEILEALLYAITTGEGVIKVVGEVGSGKTMLCRMLEVKLPPEVEIVYLANPSLSPGDILHAIALEMEIEVAAGASRVQLLHALQQRLLEKHAGNRRVVVFVEEAQGMELSTLEEIRLLSNLETEREKLLQIVLFGQPELDRKLDDRNIRQLRERITHSFHLPPFSAQDIREYLAFRLHAVGYRGPSVFRQAAYRLLAQSSAGLIRRVNILADKALLAAFADNTHNVARRHVRAAVRDSEFDPGRRRGGAGLAAGLLLALAAAGAWWLHAGPPVTMRELLALVPASASGAAAPAAPAPVAAAAPAQGAVTPAAAALEEAAAGAAAAVGTRPGEAPEAAAEPLGAARDAPRESPAPRAPQTLPAPRSPLPPGGAAPSAEAHAGAGPPAVERPPRPPAAPIAAVAPEEVSGAPSAPAGGSGPAPLLPAPDAEPAPAGPGGRGAPDAAAVRAQPRAPVPGSAPGKDAPSAPPAPPAAGGDAMTARADAAAGSAAQVAGGGSGVVPASDTGGGGERQPGSAAAGGASLLEARLAATAEWLARADRDHLSIQLLMSEARRAAELERFLQEQERAGEIDHIYVYETIIGGELWYGVLYEEYATMSEARAALARLTPELRRRDPFIRNIRDITVAGEHSAAGFISLAYRSGYYR